ncbi:hypothetical protein D9757_002609 [Collybiopsis confluens]|uniref:Promethin n=1 Tax=Collybiopsis confluens TaxID=2823264 RepID=A0A8H5HVZ8_9AGAR|nr:hypothetical protein D9757_002609 [Collybiopsis confluens]
MKHPAREASFWEDYLSSNLQQSQSKVTGFTRWIEQNFARPALEHGLALYEAHPFLSAFAAVFALLSVLPVSIFLGVCLSVLAFLVVSALSAVFILFVVTMLAFGCILLLVLLVNAFVSVFIVFSLASTYVSYKVAFSFYNGGLGGARTQIIELYKTIASIPHERSSDKSSNPKAEDDEKQEHSDASETSSPDSTVIIDNTEGPMSDSATYTGEDHPKKVEDD